MRQQKLLITRFIVVMAIGGLFYFLMVFSNGPKEGQIVDTVFIGSKKEASTFDDLVKAAKPFYNLFNQALQASNLGDNETAIRLLNESLLFVALGPEKAMVYRKLSEIYKAQGNLEKELFCVEDRKSVV